MIPRRKLSIHSNDFVEWLKALSFQSGDDVSLFEHNLKKYLGCKYAITTASGRDAIELVLDALDISPEDEIIIPAYTLGELLPLINAKLIPCDIEKDTFNIDIKQIEKKINAQTKAILATHLMGAPCDIINICKLAKEHGIWVIEDCAHALGASVLGQKVGTFGNASIFSLEVNKAIPTYGGGILVTNERSIATSVASKVSRRRKLESPALRKALFTWMEEMVIRSPFYALLAKILFSERISKKFERFYRNAHNRVRTDKVAYSNYQSRIGINRLAALDVRNKKLNERWNILASNLPNNFIPQNRKQIGIPAFYNFVCMYKKNINEFRRNASNLGLDVGIGSEIMDDCGSLLGATDCPNAAYLFERAILLPLYEDLSEKDFKRLISLLKSLSK
ncbi:DegT/DnrJ/EryC1/StrS aminotransferase [Candidatus Magnetomorum sp. HK-1]|nr:DegT/DnrJ/EryC1/StrS aminotransferase [Candidatus Magnetomorum sp. HK-1]